MDTNLNSLVRTDSRPTRMGSFDSEASARAVPEYTLYLSMMDKLRWQIALPCSINLLQLSQYF